MAYIMKRRADVLLFEKGLVRSRRIAADLIIGEKVRVAGELVRKPSQEFPLDTVFEILEAPRFVGRGGEKLHSALDMFAVDVSGLVCLDIGASTGGATDCLVQKGAQKVYAVDVGKNQLAESLRKNPSIISLEETDIRDLASLPEKVDLVFIDVSFISLSHIVPVLERFLVPHGQVIALIKPQFEVGRADLPRDGVVKDEVVRKKALFGVKEVFLQYGFDIQKEMDCPVIGQSGNQEFLILAQKV